MKLYLSKATVLIFGLDSVLIPHKYFLCMTFFKICARHKCSSLENESQRF